ncbi:MAG: hypothetical protein R3D70_00830 [Rhizobiaceae bacterium]
MAATAKIEKIASDDVVNVMLTGGRVTAGFRASLFAAAGREGVSVNEYVLTAAARALRHRGARFDGVFAPGDIEPAHGCDPYNEGGSHKIPLLFTSVMIPEREHRAIMAAREGQNLSQWAVELIKAEIERRAAGGVLA